MNNYCPALALNCTQGFRHVRRSESIATPGGCGAVVTTDLDCAYSNIAAQSFDSRRRSFSPEANITRPSHLAAEEHVFDKRRRSASPDRA